MLQLQIDTDSELGHQDLSGQYISATINCVMQPMTMSSVMVVTISDPRSIVRNSILKIYDHRFAAGLRKYKELLAWNDGSEKDFVSYVESGEAAKFLGWLNVDNEDEDLYGDSDEWSSSQKEVFNYNRCSTMYNAEFEVYNALIDLQGKCIPRFYASVRLQSITGNLDHSEFFTLSGILIEYVDGFSLSDIKQWAPKEAWQGICDETVRAVNTISTRDVLNMDVRPDNCLVRKTTESEYQAVIIDFGHSELREKYETGEDWMQAKFGQDEEGCIGVVMSSRLKPVVRYEPSFMRGFWRPYMGEAMDSNKKIIENYFSKAGA